MRILIATFTLEHHTGAELYVRDMARALRRRGHEIATFALCTGDLAQQMRSEGLDVVSDLSRLAMRPDIIFAHHQPALIAALRCYPSAPAVHVVHDATSILNAPFAFPRVRRHVAVDLRCLARIAADPGIGADEESMILNFVDLDRFKPRAALPLKPRKALVFSNYAKTAEDLAALQDACAASGLSLDFVGIAAGRMTARPEDLLGDYDVVFAKARAAIEAMAVGCAVILYDFAGFGGLVTSRDFDHLRAWNFGAGVLTGQVSHEAILAELAKYDAADAASVSERIRAEAGLEQAVDQWLALFNEVLAEVTPRDQPADRRSLAQAHRYWRRTIITSRLRLRLIRFRDQRSTAGLLYRLGRGLWRTLGSPGAVFK